MPQIAIRPPGPPLSVEQDDIAVVVHVLKAALLGQLAAGGGHPRDEGLVGWLQVGLTKGFASYAVDSGAKLRTGV